jgi:membrane protein YqaA with SNARE-associated domain
MKHEHNFNKNEIFEYNTSWNYYLGVFKISIVALIIIFGIIFYFFLRNTNIMFIDFIKSIFSNIYSEIKLGSILGAIYTTLFGGLFFVFLPLEVLFITFLDSVNPILLTTIFMIGLSISYMTNYFVGMYFAKFVKHLIGAEQFYKTKGIMNKYGKMTILIMNLTPQMPSQQLAAILGVFKYNKMRFYAFFFLGNLIKFVTIAFLVLQFNLFT